MLVFSLSCFITCFYDIYFVVVDFDWGSSSCILYYNILYNFIQFLYKNNCSLTDMVMQMHSVCS